MDSKWEKIEQAITAISEISPDEREGWLADFCSDDEKLKAEINSLLAFEPKAENFLEKPVAYYAAKVLSEDEKDVSGKLFGNYRIIREIGRGGMGTVFLAERSDGEFNQTTALKIVRQTILNTEAENRFRRERQILASLNHPNIAQLFDGGVSDEGEPFLVMEYIEGKPLLDFAENNKLPIEERLKLFLKICSAVAFAHRNLIVHRDIKPSNIIVTKNGEPKLLDFGLAKALEFENDSEQTVTSFRAMTPAYASPEQLQGQNITTASDIYSLGVVLYELLTGKRPYDFSSSSYDEILRHVTEDEPTKPSLSTNLNSHSPVRPTQLRGDLDNIVLMSLRKEPERRYKSVEAFSNDIKQHLNKLPVSARPSSFTYRTEKFISRNKPVVIAASIIFLAIISALVVSLKQTENARRQRDAANQEKLRAERINKFLRQMLSFSNQSIMSVSPVAKDKNVTVNEMLDEIAPQIETEFADAPKIRAQILQTIGSSYASQGFYEKGEKYLRESVKTPLEDNVIVDAEEASALAELGVVLYREGKLEDSSQYLEKAVTFYRRQQEDDQANFSPVKLALALDYLGVVKFYQRDFGTANKLLNEAFQIASTANFQNEDRQVLTFIKSDYGGFLIYAGDPVKGESIVREAIDEYRQNSVKPRWELGTTLMMLGIRFIAKNQLDEAESTLHESEQILKQTLGEQNIYIGNIYNQQATIFYKKGEYTKAEEKARLSIEVFKKTFSDVDLLLTQPLTILGNSLTKIGRAREGEDYLRQELMIFQNLPTKYFTAIAVDKLDLSECLAAQKRYAEAEILVREAQEEIKKNLGEQSPLLKTAADKLSDIYKKEGKSISAQNSN